MLHSLALMRESQNIAISAGCRFMRRVEERERLMHGPIDESALPRHRIWAQQLTCKQSNELSDPFAHIALRRIRTASSELPAPFLASSTHLQNMTRSASQLRWNWHWDVHQLISKLNGCSIGKHFFGVRPSGVHFLCLVHRLTSSVNSETLPDLLHSPLQSLTQLFITLAMDPLSRSSPELLLTPSSYAEIEILQLLSHDD